MKDFNFVASCYQRMQSVIPITEVERDDLRRIAASIAASEGASTPTPTPAPAPVKKEKKPKAEKPKAEKPNAEKVEEASSEEDKDKKFLDEVNLDEMCGDALSNKPATFERDRKFMLASIDHSKCLARKLGDKIPNTKPLACYEKQCSRKAASGQQICETCKGMKDKSEDPSVKIQMRRDWHGLVTEAYLEHSTLVGGAWYSKHYPMGLPDSAAEAPAPEKKAKASKKEEASAVKVTKAEIAKAEVTKEEPAKEAEVTAEAATSANEVDIADWTPMWHNGVSMMRNIKDGRVYKCDETKRGAASIDFTEPLGRWTDGELDAFDTDF